MGGSSSCRKLGDSTTCIRGVLKGRYGADTVYNTSVTTELKYRESRVTENGEIAYLARTGDTWRDK